MIAKPVLAADLLPAGRLHASSPGRPLDEPAGHPVVEVVVPVYNEERDLGPSVRRLRAFLDTDFPFSARITIADNASTDGTLALANALAAELPGVAVLHLPQKGRGRALKAAWLASDADVVAYMDVDLSTDLKALLPLVAPLLSGHSDLAIGSRLARGARVVRGPKRELISRSYNLILRTALGARFSDAQCGFKAMRADVAHRLLPLVDDPAWFFDTELLVLAQRSGLRTHEVPVDWTDDPDSRVHIVPTAMADLRGVARLLRQRRALGRPAPRPVSGQVARFAAIGAVSTLAYVALYTILRGTFGAAVSNALALVVTAVANTAANRRLTFGVKGGEGMVRHQVAGLVAFLLALTVTSTSIGLLHAITAQPSRAAEIMVLVIANAVATALRFLVLRRVIDRADAPGMAASAPATALASSTSVPGGA